MSTFRPYTVARYGVYLAIGVAVMSVWLGANAGATLDFTILRGVFVFLIVTALGFGAEAVLTLSPVRPPRPVEPDHHSAPDA